MSSQSPLPSTPNNCTFTDFQVAMAVVEAAPSPGGPVQEFAVFVAVAGSTTYQWILTAETAELMRDALSDILTGFHQKKSALQMPKGRVIHTPDGPKVIPINRDQETS